MKVKITTTLVLEIELHQDWYDTDDRQMTYDEIIAFETERATTAPSESSLLEEILSDGEISAFKIEKLQDASPAQEKAA
jgi:hypothetical protein